MENDSIKLTNRERGLVRKAITRHLDWTNYRHRHGIGAANLTSAKCLIVCNIFGIDVKTVLLADADPERMPVLTAGELAKIEAAQKSNDAADAIAKEHAAKRAADFEAGVKDAEAKVQSLTADAVQPSTTDDALAALRVALGGSVDADKVRAIVEAAVAPIRDAVANATPALLVIDKERDTKREIDGLRHYMLEDLIVALNARDNQGARLNVWLSGPAGSGKTYGVHQAATALGLDFAFHGAMTMSHELTGFVDGHGKYHETQFAKIYRHGGVILLDECDAGSNEALLAINAPLANGSASLPNGEMLQKHPDCRIVAAANTFGSGATAEYIGRTKIDQAFLDRFHPKLNWDYDEKLERAMSGNLDWTKQVQRARKLARAAGMKVCITPRASLAGAALIAAGMDQDKVAGMTYLAGLTKDQASQLEGAV